MLPCIRNLQGTGNTYLLDEVSSSTCACLDKCGSKGLSEGLVGTVADINLWSTSSTVRLPSMEVSISSNFLHVSAISRKTFVSYCTCTC